jgi:hypothetical protein
MSDEEDVAEIPLTEPAPITCVYITGAAIEVTRHVARTVGWAALPALDGAKERRIEIRFAMPIDAARAYWRDLGDELKGKSR